MQEQSRGMAGDGGDPDEIDLREVFDLLKSGRWLILACVGVALLLAIFYIVFAKPTYQVTGLVQVDQSTQAGGVAQALGGLASMLTGGSLVTDAEIQIIQSRLVLNPAIDKLNLLVDAKPNYFPIIGYAIAQWVGAGGGAKGSGATPQPAGAPPLLGHFAWGGESISVAEFETAPGDYDQAFSLKATAEGYELTGPQGNTVLSGVVGKPASGTTDNGPVHILVRSMTARPGETFNVTRHARQTVLKNISENLSVAEQGKQSGVIQIAVTGHDKVAAQALVDAIENSYIAQDVAKNSAQAKQSLAYLEAQLPQLRAKLDAAQDKLASYQKTHGAADIASETQLLLKQAVALDTEHSQLVQQREQALQRFTSQHPVVQGLNRQIATVERNQAELKKQISNLPGTQQQVLDLMRELDVNTQLYTTMLDAIQQFQVTKAGTIGNVRIVDHGMLPLKPVSPKKGLTLVLAVVLGGFIGVAIVFLRRALLRGVDDPAIVERALGLDVMASVPLAKRQAWLARRFKSHPEQGQLLALDDSEDMAIEALRSLRTALRLSSGKPPTANGGRVLDNITMFTGPTPGVGKSFVSSNYAALLALSGARVALVDLDLRLGHLADSFGLLNEPGMHLVLEGSRTLDSVRQGTHVEGLDFYGRGVHPKHPAELLMRPELEQSLAALSAAYDHVVIDAPPVLAVSDAAVIGEHAGATLLVLESARHPMREIEETVKRLVAGRVRLRGAVFNRVGARAGSYGYGDYGYTRYSYKKS